MSRRIGVLVGKRHGRLVVAQEVTEAGKPRHFLTVCDCGTSVRVSLTHLRSGHTGSCGCAKDAANLPCAITDCPNIARRGGVCNGHFMRARQGSSLGAEVPIRATDPNGTRRLSERVTPDGECLRWAGTCSYAGYGQISVDGRIVGAHRVAYELAKGRIPDGLEIDHLCAVRNCVNPDHLEAVTHEENLRRARDRQAVAS